MPQVLIRPIVFYYLLHCFGNDIKAKETSFIISKLYKDIVLTNPKSIFLLLIITLISFGYFSKEFKLDASSDTLLIDGDPDLQYLREVTERYGAK